MSGIQLGAGNLGGVDLENNSGHGGAEVGDQNGERPDGIATTAERRSVTPTTPLVGDPRLSRPAASGGENSLQRPLLGNQAGDIDIEKGVQDDEENEENEALEEIDNILWIKQLEINHQNRCNEALESWSKKETLFTSRIDRKRKQSSDYQNEVYQLIGFYTVFEGVLLTAVSQSNLLHCNNTWTATLLSALASVVTLIGVILKLRKIKELECTIADEEVTRRTLVNWQMKLRETGERFDFTDAKAKRGTQEKKTSWWLGASFFAVAVVLVIFSVTFVVSIRQILCNPGHTLVPSGPFP